MCRFFFKDRALANLIDHLLSALSWSSDCGPEQQVDRSDDKVSQDNEAQSEITVEL